MGLFPTGESSPSDLNAAHFEIYTQGCVLETDA